MDKKISTDDEKDLTGMQAHQEAKSLAVKYKDKIEVPSTSHTEYGGKEN